MNSKEIIITFDFELYLGNRSGSVEKCLLKPTLELKKIIDAYNLSTIFFVDTLYLHRLKEISLTNDAALFDYKAIITLLQSLIDSRATIFHHIHPHWLDAIYLEDSNEWDVSNKSRFALVNLSDTEIENVFFYSNQIISEIYQGKVSPAFSGFRAGGLYAQPFEKYKNQFEKYSIKVDFSVLKNSKSSGENGVYSFDYSKVPSENIYPFSNDVIKSDENGAFIEIMMKQFKLQGISKVINGLYYRRNYKTEAWQRWGDGKASGNVLKSTKKTNRWVSEETYSIELLNKYKASLYLKKLKKEDFLHIISHPKLFSPANIQAFDKFIKKVKRKYNVETDVFTVLNNVGIKGNKL